MFATAAPVFSAPETGTGKPDVVRRSDLPTDLVRKEELAQFATKAEVAELRAQLEHLRARLNAIRAQVGQVDTRLQAQERRPVTAKANRP